MATDVLIVGGGAAGVAAAVVAARSGCTVTLLDSGPAIGGQYYRGAERHSPGRKRHPVSEIARRVGLPRESGLSYAALRRDFGGLVDAGRIDLRLSTYAYALEHKESGFVLRTRGDDRHRGETQSIATRTVVIATGAFDRQLPFPGWTLPGVMSGGGAQALVKGSVVLPGQRIVVAGTGPFLLAVAHALISAGGDVVAVVEANDPLALARHTRAVLPAAGKSADLARFIAALAGKRVPYLRRHRVRRADGHGRLDSVTLSRVDADWRGIPGSERVLECDALAIGYGFTAQTDLAGQVGARMLIGSDGGLAIEVDGRQRASVPGLLAAGETTGVGGVDLARVEGIVAGTAAVEECGGQPALAASAISGAVRDVVRLRGFADALHATFPVRDGWRDDVAEDTVVCRCEEVTAGKVREAVSDLGARDARSVKLLTRAGMGWCQGRVCAPAVDGLCRFDSAASLIGGSYRPVAVPVPLGAIAVERMSP